MKDLEYFKKELIKILDKKEREEKAEIKKSLAFTMDMLIEKSSSGYPVGTIREWKGKKYQKIAPGKWRRKYSNEEKGIRMSIAALKKAIDKCSTSQELLDLVLQNRDRFADDNGRPLPIVKELSEYVSKKNDNLEYISKEGKTQKEYAKELKDLKRRNAEDYNKKRAEHIRQDIELNTVTYNQELLSRKEAEKEISKHKNKLFENKETELKVSYNSEGAGKLISQKAVDKSINNGYSREEHFTIASHITDIFKNANLISVEPDRDSDINDNVTEVRRYATKFILNGKEGFALMTVKINKDDTKKMYAIELNYLAKKIELATSGAVKDNSNNANTHRVDEPRRQTSSSDNIAQNNSPVNKKMTYATDVCKSIEDLTNYAKENYGITIKNEDKKGGNTEKILKCFDITERFIKKVPGLEKYVKTIVYGKIDHKTMGYYNQNDRLLKVGEFGEDVTEEQVRTGYYGEMKHTVRHEMTHAIQHMIVNEYLSDKKKEQYEQAFKESFRNAYYTGKPKDMAKIANFFLHRVIGGQDFLAAAFDLFKEYKDGDYYRSMYSQFARNLVSEKIVDTALSNLGIDKKRRHFSLKTTVGKNVEALKGATKEVARISKYALSEDAECMADAIADALGSGENAAPLSKEILKVVENIVGSKGTEMLKSIYAKKKPLFVVKKAFADNFMNKRSIPTLQNPTENFYYTLKKNLEKSLTWSGHKLQDRTSWNGLKISIENKKGSVRRGVDKDGHQWATKMHFDYGYIRGSEGTDGDHVDCYLGDNMDAKKVYIVHQNDPVTYKYDEDKCMLGFDTLEDAKKAYLMQYDRPGFLGKIDTMDFDEFKEFILLKRNHGKKIIKSYTDFVKSVGENFDFETMRKVCII